MNSVIRSVNKLLGDEETSGSSSPAASASHPATSSSSSSTGGLLGTVLSVPQAIGSAAASAFQILAAPAAQKRVDGPAPSTSSSSSATYSEVSMANPANAAALGLLGAGAVGTLLWSMYVQDVENRRRHGQFRRRKKRHASPISSAPEDVISRGRKEK